MPNGKVSKNRRRFDSDSGHNGFCEFLDIFLLGYFRYLDGYHQGIREANEGTAKPGVSVRILDLPIEALCLTVGAVQCLRDAGFEKIAELLLLDEKEIKRIPKLWTKRRQEIAKGLKHYQICNEVWRFYLPYEQKNETVQGE